MISRLGTGLCQFGVLIDGPVIRIIDANPRVSPHLRMAADPQRQAWAWAAANRTPDGQLPTVREIGERFGRGERWGRLVKQAGPHQ
jgi:hypothetical protein